MSVQESWNCLQRQTVGGIAYLLVALAMLWPLTAAAAANPVLVLEPDRGCKDPRPVTAPDFKTTARGEYFPPGRGILLFLGELDAVPGRDRFAQVGQVTVAADGTFSTQIRIDWCLPQTPAGVQFKVIALPQGPDGWVERNDVLASAIFTVASSSGPLPGLPNTGSGLQIHALLHAVWPVAAGVLVLLAVVSLSWVGLQRRVR